MSRIAKKFGLFAAVLSMVAVMAAGGAQAAPTVGVGVIAGTGIINPGLGLTPTAQSGTFNGTGVVAVAPAGPVATGNCVFNFSSVGLETDLIGGGTATGSCTIGVGVVGGTITGCNVAYTRVGVVVIVTGSCSVSGNPTTVASVLVFAPTSTPGQPVTAYGLAGPIAFGPNT
jgi:hypothetical protein